ncbi:MAG TPA: DUF1206 domain-containing protein [Microbacterium sp.]|nr:DUF1206 domain-containing protein [Microbacterium sp.]
MDPQAPKRAAREAQSHRSFRWTARAGYAASGVVHILIGSIALVVAFGGDGETDQAGALTVIAAAPLGFVVLWVLAATLCALGIWHILEGIRVQRPSDDAVGGGKKWGARIGEWGQAAVFIALGLISAAVAVGARVDAETAAERASAGLLRVPGGSIVLGLVGLGVAITGITFVVMGVTRSFRKKVEIPEHGLGRSVAGLGVIGFVAKGVSLLILGVLLIIAAVTTDADVAGALDGALRALLALAYGPLLVGAVGVGFIAYGLFSIFRAPFARLDPS